jgi:hypothetical protein|tara:strand:- start:474 stop:1856 length:1383 start_codon:yes stop_codon:yes gene_type:complete
MKATGAEVKAVSVKLSGAGRSQEAPDKGSPDETCPNNQREYLSPPPVRSGQQPSPVWSFLKRFTPVNAKGHNIECFVELAQTDGSYRPCGCTIKWGGPSSGTANLLTHLKRHPAEHQLCLEQSKHSARAREKMTIPAIHSDDTTTNKSLIPGACLHAFLSQQPPAEVDLGDCEEDRFVTLSQLQHQQPTFPVEEAFRNCGGTRSGKIINDPVHGHMYFPGLVVDAIDTPQVQRLRELKQLGTAYYVFPGASHNRFEHSLGTCHLATNMFEALKRSSGKCGSACLDHVDKISIQLAGLCHDLGHGPFSHVFDNEFLPRRYSNWDRKNPLWNHEVMSANMFEWMVDENHIDIGEDVVKRVRGLITSEDSNAITGKRFLWDIVANKRNSVDVDKFDYLMRDSHNAGVKGSADISRLVSFMKVIDDEICFKASEVHNVYELFHTRASLHQKVYTHRKAKAIEYM